MLLLQHITFTHIENMSILITFYVKCLYNVLVLQNQGLPPKFFDVILAQDLSE